VCVLNVDAGKKCPTNISARLLSYNWT